MGKNIAKYTVLWIKLRSDGYHDMIGFDDIDTDHLGIIFFTYIHPIQQS